MVIYTKYLRIISFHINIKKCYLAKYWIILYFRNRQFLKFVIRYFAYISFYLCIYVYVGIYIYVYICYIAVIVINSKLSLFNWNMWNRHLRLTFSLYTGSRYINENALISSIFLVSLSAVKRLWPIEIQKPVVYISVCIPVLQLVLLWLMLGRWV